MDVIHKTSTSPDPAEAHQAHGVRLQINLHRLLTGLDEDNAARTSRFPLGVHSGRSIPA